MRKSMHLGLSLFLLGFVAFATGCSFTPAVQTTAVTTGSYNGVSITGKVFGGQQPISSSHVYLFAAGVGGYAGPGIAASAANASSSLLKADSTGHSDAIGAYVLSDANGNFSISGDYTCTAGQQVYMYALGGNSGTGVNTAAGLLAALGNCPGGNLATQVPTVIINEVSTIAAAYAFAGFATDATHVSSSGTTLAQTGIANAFAVATNLDILNNSFGAPAKTPGGNGTVPQARINTLGNILAACVNTAGPTSAACVTLLGNAKNGAVSPTDTATAAINIAHNQAANVTALSALSSGTGPFQPSVTAPTDFSLTLAFTGTNVSSPTGIAIDSVGNAWVANFGNTYALRFSPLGVNDYYYSYGHLLQPYGVAIDPTGNLWFTATGGPYVYEITAPGTNAATGGYIGPFPVAEKTRQALDASGNFYAPASNGTASNLYYSLAGNFSYVDVSTLIGGNAYATAVDTNGIFWTTSYSPTATGSATLLAAQATSTGVNQLNCTGANYTSGSGIAIDHANAIWISDYVTGYVVQFANNCTLAAGYNTGGLAGTHPVGIAMDGNGSPWTVNTANSVIGLTSAGVPISGTAGYASGVTGTLAGPVIDGSGNLWFTNTTANTVNEMIGVAAPVVTPIAAGLVNNTLATKP